jgi:hypothetical protein
MEYLKAPSQISYGQPEDYYRKFYSKILTKYLQNVSLTVTPINSVILRI